MDAIIKSYNTPNHEFGFGCGENPVCHEGQVGQARSVHGTCFSLVIPQTSQVCGSLANFPGQCSGLWPWVGYFFCFFYLLIFSCGVFLR